MRYYIVAFRQSVVRFLVSAVQLPMSLPAAEIETIAVDDTQVETEQPDNQEGLTQPSFEESNGCNSDPAQAAPPLESPPAAAPEESHQEPKVGPVMPDTQLYVDGSQGPMVEAEEDEGQKDDRMVGASAGDEEPASSSAQLVRQDAFLEEDDDLEQAMMRCKKCQLEVKLEESVIRGPTELWCRECNSIYMMLRRHQAWPPQSFAKLDDAAQAQFWQRQAVQVYKDQRHPVHFTC